MGSILSMVFSALSGPILDKLIAPLTHIFDAYMNKQITEAQLREKVQELLLGTFKDVEISHADTLAKTYETFMSAAKVSPILQRMWALTAGSMLFVLLWHMLAIPAIVWYTGAPYPGSGSTVNWAYALLGGCLGMGPLVLRTGPGADVTSRLKALVGK